MFRLKKLIRPLWRRVRMFLSTTADYLYDYRTYLRFNGFMQNKEIRAVEGRMLAHYHVIEKGLSFANTKPLFALPVVLDLVKLLDQFERLGGKTSGMYDACQGALLKYQELNKGFKGYPSDLDKYISKIIVKPKVELYGGAKHFQRDEFFAKSAASFDQFSQSRYSVRDFCDKPVPRSDVDKCIEIARKTPSVCNRQTVLCYVFSKEDEIRRCLDLQLGNRGFGRDIRCLIAVAYDIRLFEGNRERNQGFVDGGMFAMSLLYALHWNRLGAVPLNWSYSALQNKALEATGLIKPQHRVVMFIGVGIPSDSFKVPISNRRSLDDIIANR